MDVAPGATNLQISRVWLSGLIVAFAVLSPPSAQAALGDNPIHHSADKEYWDRKANRIEMFGHARVEQPGEILTADYITLDLNLKILDARGNCYYISTESVIRSEEMHFNLETHTGTVVQGRVSNDKFTLSGERINKLAEGRFQTHWGEYTTCHDCAKSWSLLAEDVDLQFDGYAYMSNVTAKVKDAPAFWLPYMVIPVKTRRQTGFLFPTFQLSGPFGFAFVEPFFWAISREADMTIGAGTYTNMGRRLEYQGRYVLTPRNKGEIDIDSVNDGGFALSGNLAPELAGNSNIYGAPYNNPSGNTERWGVKVAQLQELPYHVDEKVNLNLVSDNAYPATFPLDSPYGSEPELPSEVSLSHAGSDVSAFASARFYRDLIDVNPDIRDWDENTVNVLPQLEVTTNDQMFHLFGQPFAAGLTLEASNFTRNAAPFDYDPSRLTDTNPNGTLKWGGYPGAPALAPNLQPGYTPMNVTCPGSPIVYPNSGYIPCVDPLRDAVRGSITPNAYTTFRPFDMFEVIPSAQYRNFFYNFHDFVPPLYQSYALFQTDISAQIERIYDTDNPDRPKLKHLIRPDITFSYIPPTMVHYESGAAFNQAINHSIQDGFGGAYFDNNDIIPIDASPGQANYFYPEGKAVAAGFTTQLIQRRGAVDAPKPVYVEEAEFSMGTAFDFNELENSSPYGLNLVQNTSSQPWSRVYANLLLNLNDHLSSATTYYYYPDPGSYATNSQEGQKLRHTVTTSLSYTLENAIHDGILKYNRSFTVAYALDKVTCTDPSGCTSIWSATLNYSLNDYIMPTLSMAYSTLQTNTLGTNVVPRWQSAMAAVTFQSPSRCWEFTGGFTYGQGIQGFGSILNLSVNLSGEGYGGMSDAQAAAAAPH